MQVDALDLYLSGHHAGVVFRDRYGDIQLRYDDEWLDLPEAYPLSLSLPLERPRHKTKKVRNVLNGLLPESRAILTDWQRRFRISDMADPLEVLSVVGRDVAGAVQFLPAGDDPEVLIAGAVARVSEAEVAEMIREARESGGAMPTVEEVPRISLAGQQAKFGLSLSTYGWRIPFGSSPSTHIFKPAPPELDDMDLVELAMLRAAHLVGLRTARSSVETIAGERVFVSERYDRLDTEEGVTRIHQEDMIQALGHPTAMKYGRDGGVNLSRIVELLRDNDVGPQDLDELVRLTAFNVAIGNADAHGKNHSVLIHLGGSVSLAPAYDLVSVAPYPAYHQELAFPIGRQWDYRKVGTDDWVQMASDTGMDTDRVLDLVRHVWDRAPKAVEQALASVNAPPAIAGPIVQVVESLAARTPARPEPLWTERAANAVVVDPIREWLVEAIPAPLRLSEEDGMVITTVEATPVVVEAQDVDGAIDAVARALRKYAEDWDDDLHQDLYHLSQWGLIQLVQRSTDEQLHQWLQRED